MSICVCTQISGRVCEVLELQDEEVRHDTWPQLADEEEGEKAKPRFKQFLRDVQTKFIKVCAFIYDISLIMYIYRKHTVDNRYCIIC